MSIMRSQLSWVMSVDGGGAGDARDVHEHVDAAIDRACAAATFSVMWSKSATLNSMRCSFLALGLAWLSATAVAEAMIQIGQNDLRAEVRQTAGGRLADAAAAAGHHGHLALH